MSFKKDEDVFPMSMGGQLLTASRWGSCALLGPSPWRLRRSPGSWAQAVPVVMRPVAHVAGATKRSGPRRRMSFSDGRTWFLVILEDCDNNGDKDSDDKHDISFCESIGRTINKNTQHSIEHETQLWCLWGFWYLYYWDYRCFCLWQPSWNIRLNIQGIPISHDPLFLIWYAGFAEVLSSFDSGTLNLQVPFDSSDS